jgi:hypothetical protein
MSSSKPIAIRNEGDENMDNSSVYAGVTMLDVLGSGTNRKMDIKDHRVKVCIYTMLRLSLFPLPASNLMLMCYSS